MRQAGWKKCAAMWWLEKLRHLKPRIYRALRTLLWTMWCKNRAIRLVDGTGSNTTRTSYALAAGRWVQGWLH